MDIIDCRYGPFYTSNQKDIIYDSLRSYGEWAQLEIEVISKFIKPGSRVVDAGAFIGTFSRAMSNHIGKEGFIFAFEPNRASFNLLCKNIEIANYNNIKAYNKGLGSEAYSAYVSNDENQYNLGSTRITKQKTSEQLDLLTEVNTLDDFHFNNIDFIKADIEGMELEMLQGASKTIAQSKPVIFLELNSLTEGVGVFNWAKANAYTTFGTISDAYNEKNFKKNKENWLQDGKECGLILIHDDNLSKFDTVLVQLELCTIYNFDDLASLIMLKPQYRKNINHLCFEVSNHKHSSECQNIDTNDLDLPISEIKVYWRTHWTEQYDGYSEKSSITANSTLDGQSQRIKLHFPKGVEGITRIRLDILDCIGIVDVESMELLSPEQSTIWQWYGDIDILARQTEVVLVPSIASKTSFTVISFGSDPWFELNLPSEIYSQIEHGCSLSLQIKSYNLIAQLPTVIKGLIERDRGEYSPISRLAKTDKMYSQKHQLNIELLKVGAQIELLKHISKF